MEKWYTYILYSERIDKYYTGYCSDLDLRLERHNSGWGNYTSKGIPWKIVYHEEYNDKSSALKRESQIKRMHSRKYIEELIAEGRPDVSGSLVGPVGIALSYYQTHPPIYKVLYYVQNLVNCPPSNTREGRK